MQIINISIATVRVWLRYTDQPEPQQIREAPLPEKCCPYFMQHTLILDNISQRSTDDLLRPTTVLPFYIPTMAGSCPGFTKPVETGPAWPVTGQTGPARFRFGFGLGRYQTGPNSNLNSKKWKIPKKIPKNTSRCDESNGIKFSQNSFI